MKGTWFIAALALLAFVACENKDAAEGEARKKTEKAMRGDLLVSVTASGAIEPDFEVEVKSKASGEILSFPFEPGDAVKKGATLLTLDPKTERRNLAQREADVAQTRFENESARADVADRDRNLERAQKLFERQLVSAQDLEAATTAAAKARARIGETEAAMAKAKIALEDARDRLEETTITAPMDGVVIEKAVERGQIIASGISSVTGGTKLLVIADLSRLFIEAMVDETDVGRVRVGQKARVTVDAFPERVFEGEAVRIWPAGEVKDNITVFRVKVEILGEGKALLRPRMTANVDLVVDERKNALIIPDEAIVDKGGGKRAVYVMKGGAQAERPVTVGLTNGFETEIIEGLAEGEEVVLRPPRA